MPITSKRLTILILLDAVTMAVRLMLEDGRVKVQLLSSRCNPYPAIALYSELYKVKEVQFKFN